MTAKKLHNPYTMDKDTTQKHVLGTRMSLRCLNNNYIVVVALKSPKSSLVGRCLVCRSSFRWLLGWSGAEMDIWAYGPVIILLLLPASRLSRPSPGPHSPQLLERRCSSKCPSRWLVRDGLINWNIPSLLSGGKTMNSICRLATWAFQ